MLDLNKVKAVIFDLDDTLYSRYLAARATFPGMLRELLYENRSEEFIDEAVRLMMANVAENSMVHERVFEALTSAYPTDKPYVRAKCLDYYYDHITDFAEPFSDTYRVLEGLRSRGIRLGIITNTPTGREASQRRKVEVLGIEKYFDAIIYSTAVGLRKPDRRIYDMTAELLGVPNESCLFVGDDPASDIRGAIGADMTAVFLDRFGYGDIFKNEPRVTRVLELSDYFDNI
ncbi:MAG: HAD family hydrolase [Clostridia bacterium]|nr:HAD family hydrolase [Clostridia bacterium]